MSDQGFYAILGVNENASFEEIQSAKERLKTQYRAEPMVLESIESAYDAILRERLKMRLEGKIKVPDGVRFPEKTNNFTALNFSPKPINPPPIQTFFDQPTQRDLLWSTGIFLAIGGFVLFPGTDVVQLPFALAFAVGFSLFWLNRKERLLWRSFLLTVGAFFLAIALIYLVSMIAPLVATDAKLSGAIILVVLWLFSTFIR
jgi:Protein CHAPERONE-LIKE PROTEIN OF POR1-like